MDILESLNPAQREAAAHPGGPLLILAGPGSGKTRVITHRIAHLINELGVPPYRILAVTFTNKAAREMKDRLSGLIGIAADDVTMGTFHRVCVRILRAEADFLEIKSAEFRGEVVEEVVRLDHDKGEAFVVHGLQPFERRDFFAFDKEKPQ